MTVPQLAELMHDNFISTLASFRLSQRANLELFNRLPGNTYPPGWDEYLENELQMPYTAKFTELFLPKYPDSDAARLQRAYFGHRIRLIFNEMRSHINCKMVPHWKTDLPSGMTISALQEALRLACFPIDCAKRAKKAADAWVHRRRRGTKTRAPHYPTKEGNLLQPH
jgi:hypothetical protein